MNNNPSKKREILYNELLYSAVRKGNAKKIYDLRLLDSMGFIDFMADIKLLVNKYIELMDKNFDFKKIIIIDNIKNIN